MDGVQLCSAIYNLLLNACQAANSLILWQMGECGSSPELRWRIGFGV